MGPLVVVAEPNLLGAGGAPFERDAKLVVDAERPLAGSIAVQTVKAVARRNPKILHRRCRIEPLKTTARRGYQVSGETLAWIATFKHSLGLFTFPALDCHADRLYG